MEPIVQAGRAGRAASFFGKKIFQLMRYISSQFNSKAKKQEAQSLECAMDSVSFSNRVPTYRDLDVFFFFATMVVCG